RRARRRGGPAARRRGRRPAGRARGARLRLRPGRVRRPAHAHRQGLGAPHRARRAPRALRAPARRQPPPRRVPRVRRRRRRRLHGRPRPVPHTQQHLRVPDRHRRGDVLGPVPRLHGLTCPLCRSRLPRARPAPYLSRNDRIRDRPRGPGRRPMTAPFTTTNAGAPVASDAHSQSVGADGPIVLHDHYLVEKLAQFNRERVPERVVHAKGGGAFGTFTVANDVSAFTRAALFQPGTTTEMLARFSSVAGEQGSPDTWRDPRGFALKFYTTEGNYDLVGNNTPVFFLRDGIKFPDFIRSQKRLPGSNLRDNDMQWDFWTLSPESAHQVTWLMGDRGLPSSWRHMDGFGSHTYQWINAAGERFWVKYHFKTQQGIDNLTADEASQLAGSDSDHHIRDLYEHIEAGDFPRWTLSVQVMPYEDAKTYRFNPFDLTKVWPHADYPLVEVGVMELNRNPENYFAQIEQATFAPSNFVPGIAASPDKMLLARIFSYADAHRYRVGTNHAQLPVNAPH